MTKKTQPAFPDHAPSGLKHGLTLVLGDFGPLQQLVHAVFVMALLKGTQKLPIPMPEGTTVCVLQSGSDRQIVQQSFVMGSILSGYEEMKDLVVETIESGAPLDWTHAVAVADVGRRMALREGATFVVVQPHGIVLSSEGLMRLRMDATRLNCRVVLLAASPDSQQSVVSAMANEVFEVAVVDPEPGWTHAVSISCPALTNELDSSVGRVMCMYQAEGSSKFGFHRYVADSISIRLMSALRSRGMTLAKIGETFKQDRSTICRKLQGVPCLDATAWDDKQLADWFDACALHFEQPARGRA